MEMQLLVCPICGGTLTINENLVVGICEYCDSKFIVPKDFAKIGNLFNRAVALRRANEFDRAIAAYEDILKEDYSNSEAHWGLVLSKYGIEYVTDPKTGKYIPTCHRTQPFSILADPDFRVALKNSDPQVRFYYEDEARKIDEIQTKILEISRKESPYDIFICYKDSNDFGNRTEDSVIAQDIYDTLISKKYNVFFSRKTLANKLGQEYEPYIYAALNSAQIMLVIGTSTENINSVWVKNEWQRYLKMCRNTSKIIIPVYKGMSPNDLPVEFVRLQALDISKIGALQVLLRSIEKHLNGGNDFENEKTGFDGNVPTALRLIQTAEIAVKKNDYVDAKKTYELCTKHYPDEYRGWWGLVICDTKGLTEPPLDITELNQIFDHARKTAGDNTFQELEKEYSDYLKNIVLKLPTPFGVMNLEKSIL